MTHHASNLLEAPSEATGTQAVFAAIARARETWPMVSVPREEFAAFVATRLAAETATDPSVLNIGDLYIAYACSRGDAVALLVFEDQCRREVERAVARIHPAGITAEDALQLILEKLFVGDQTHEPRILRYGGRGSLRNWMRAIVIRAVIDLARSQRGQEHEIGLSPEGLASLPSPELDPELAHLKGTYRGEFERAFEAAVSALEPSERNALRQHLIHGLNIDQIGALYGIHRSTAARRIASARQHLLDETHARLRERLRVTAGELDSIMRLIDSQLDVSVARLLASQK